MPKRFDASIWMLIAANLVPLIGVLLWDWSIFEVVVLYWLENVIIGVINILKMVTCSPDMEKLDLKSILDERIGDTANLSERQQNQISQKKGIIDKFGGKAGALNHGSKIFLIPFFTVHYGMFCLVHGVFVFVLLGQDDMMKAGPSPAEFPAPITEAAAQGGIWAALALFVSHLFSFFTNYIGKGEYRRTAAPLLMAAPYGRIVILHIAIIFGAFATVALGSPVFLLVLLIGGKIALDIKLHLRSHRKMQEKGH